MELILKLNDWRLSKNFSYRDLAKKLGAGHATMVRRWCLPHDHVDHKKPSTQYMKIIMLATDGAVSANDFYN
tara:strand:- start:465 stop:680 length:216 start_codon:yes stop_codon:yes gene_type:complete